MPEIPPEAQPAVLSEMSGLSSDEARRRLQRLGPNAMPDTSVPWIRGVLGKFWAPVPWMLEAVIGIELGLHDYMEAVVIATPRGCSRAEPPTG